MIRAQSLQHREAVEPRQIDVQNDEIGRMLECRLQPFRAVVARDRVVLGPLQLSSDLPGQLPIVLDYEHTHVSFSARSLFADQLPSDDGFILRRFP